MAVTKCQVELADGTQVSAELEHSVNAPWTLTATVPRLGDLFTEARDLFDALVIVREWLAGYGAVILVQGAAGNVFPSGMAREAGGLLAYRFETGKFAKRDALTNIFAPAPRALIVSVQEQRANFEEWMESLRAR